MPMTACWSVGRGCFRVRGDSVELFPAHYEDRAWRLSLFGDDIEAIAEFDPLTGEKTADLEAITVFANSHYVTPRPTLRQAVIGIREELEERLRWFRDHDKPLEAERIEQRTNFDLETITATGHCAGIENYSRYLTGRAPGEPPPTLFEYLPENALVFVDESHVAVPQLGGMYRGDFNRKSTLAEFGFRLPSCVDNRPLKFEEWDAMRPQTIFVSATPGPFELGRTTCSTKTPPVASSSHGPGVAETNTVCGRMASHSSNLSGRLSTHDGRRKPNSARVDLRLKSPRNMPPNWGTVTWLSSTNSSALSGMYSNRVGGGSPGLRPVR